MQPTPQNNQKYFTFYYPFLNQLSQGRIVGLFMHYFLKTLGILSLFGFIFLCYYIIDVFFNNFSDNAAYPIAGIICILFAAIYSFGIFQILFYNADRIKKLGDSNFTVIPIVSILIRLGGEFIAYTALVGGVMAFICSLFIEINQIGFFQSFGVYSFAPVWVLLTGIFASIAAIIFSYLFAEGMVVLVDIARNVQIMQDRNSRNILGLNQIGLEQPVIAELKCSKCGSMHTEDDRFCTTCGNHLK